jgi:hypothetical protein
MVFFDGKLSRITKRMYENIPPSDIRLNYLQQFWYSRVELDENSTVEGFQVEAVQYSVNVWCNTTCSVQCE